MPLLYALADFLAWIAYRIARYRAHVVRPNLQKAFPQLEAGAIERLMRDYYRGFAEVLVEIIKSARMSLEQMRERVHIVNPGLLRERLARNQSVLLVAAHQCNWEWMLLALSADLGYPLDAAYKPLVNTWAEREMLTIRERFGARMVPAQNLLADVLQRGRITRAVALVADQEPVQSERKHWLRFLNRDSAFFLGAEEIARVTRAPTFFIAMRRLRRGVYEMRFELLAEPASEKLRAGDITERYAARVEEQIRDAPADWPWSHKRWKLHKPLYGTASRAAGSRGVTG